MAGKHDRISNPRRSKRSVRIHIMPSGLRMHVCYARTDKVGLQSYFKSILEQHGYSKPKYVGNTMQVLDPNGKVVLYVAHEEIKK